MDEMGASREVIALKLDKSYLKNFDKEQIKKITKELFKFEKDRFPVGDTGESLRGYTTHMAIIDEAGYIPEVVYDAFLPSTATTRARILLTSTPRGKSGAFYNACEKSFAIYRHGVREDLHEKDFDLSTL